MIFEEGKTTKALNVYLSDRTAFERCLAESGGMKTEKRDRGAGTH
jgi:hypothetical protein